MTPEERQPATSQLSAHLMRLQPAIDEVEARRVAQEVASDDEVLEVASRWMETGEWPAEPLFVGWTAADLGRLYRPSLVLTSLLWLKRDPEAAKASLKHAFADPEVPYTPDLTTDPVAAGFFSRRKPASEKS